MKKFIFILLLINSFAYRAQQINYFSDCFYGSVTGGGYNPAASYTAGTINLHVPPASSIRKAFLFASIAKYNNQSNFNTPRNVIINGDTVKLDVSYSLQNNYIVLISSPPPPPYEYITIVKDITNLSSIQSQSVITITPPVLNGTYIPIYWEFYILILYENNTMPKTAVDVFVNNQDAESIENYSLLASNSVDFTKDVGVALNTAALCDTIQDGSFVYVNTNPIGIIGGGEYNSAGFNCASVSGNFYYENNTLYGLTDDTPDALMEGADALANIQSYGTNNPIDLKFVYQSNLALKSNIINQLFLTYTTPCDTFSVNLLTEDTTICKGKSVQLSASRGIKYEWLPATGLSCSNCANPVASPDSTMIYTVRVWNTDSCSKVLPVRVKVLPQPKFTSIVTTPSACGDNTGGISTSSTGSLADADSLFSNVVYVGKTPKTLTNLSTGNYTLYLVDTNSCKSKDTMVTINSVNLTNALFTLNPTTGAVPLSVSSDNQSTHATDYMWYFQNDSTTITSPSFEFDTSGTYTITLIAYNNTPDCSDTFSLQIIVYDSLQLIIPNVFTPNGDNQNDVFSIQVNAPCTGTITITNRWGNEMLSKNISTNGKQKLLIWDSMTANGKASDGVYFYSLSLRDKENKEYHFQGFVELLR
ncbi:MAG: gliding motility-associated C-terminal domain-containing protein [Crocinitomicaceae bacterium]